MAFRRVKQQSETARSESSRRQVADTEFDPNDASRISVYGFASIAFCASMLLFVGAWYLLAPLTVMTFVLAACVGVVAAMSVHVVPEWERVVILRFGKFRRIAGPGLYFCIPFVDSIAIHIDQRTMTTSFSAEAALTADLVPVDVDAILFWMVWDAKKACLEVKNYPKAVLRTAQTALRDAIGQLNLADISTRRKQIDHELEKMLDSKCEAWGITVLSVEIRDIVIPEELQDALSREAQAERERNARIILAEVEKDISEMFVEAADVYAENPDAMKLRAMNLAYEGVCSSGGVLLAPSDLAGAFNVGGKG
nr:slipin family protein [uncultured Slackia sp.]